MQTLNQKTGIYFSAEKYRQVLDFCDAEGIVPKNYTLLMEYLMLQVKELRAKQAVQMQLDADVQRSIDFAEEVEALLHPFLLKTNHAFSLIFLDESFVGMDKLQLMDMMLDFCQRDPTNEFPLQVVAQKIYNEVKNQSNEAIDSVVVG